MLKPKPLFVLDVDPDPAEIIIILSSPSDHQTIAHVTIATETELALSTVYDTVHKARKDKFGSVLTATLTHQ